MFYTRTDIETELKSFLLDGAALPYNSFVARLHNYCRSLGFEPGKILPSRAFCSDENQGYPIILIAKHFGAFPFNHGRVGGIVATDRHGPHAHHGQDLVIIHATHVGYVPTTGEFGVYQRVHTEHCEVTAACGKLEQVLAWYRMHYTRAQQSIMLHRSQQELLVTIDNALLDIEKNEGLILHLDRMIADGQRGQFRPRQSSSTTKSYVASSELHATLGEEAWPRTGRQPIGQSLSPHFFHFRRASQENAEPREQLEINLMAPMPWIVASRFPLLTAAQANVQVEFDRTYRTIVEAEAYRRKRLIFLSGLHIDISPQGYQAFPATMFTPWAAYVQDRKGDGVVLEQKRVLERLLEQPEQNPDALDLELSITEMQAAEDIQLRV